MSRRRYTMTPSGLRRERSDTVASRCDICHGEGLLELAPLDPPRDNRFACVLCRADQRRRNRGPGTPVSSNTADDPPEVASFTCPECGAVSYNPGDIRAGYCGSCHDWTGPGDDLVGRPFTDVSVKDEVL